MREKEKQMSAHEQQHRTHAPAPAGTSASAEIDHPKPDHPVAIPTPTTRSPSTPFLTSLPLPNDHNTLTPDSLEDDDTTLVAAGTRAAIKPDGLGAVPSHSSAGHRHLPPIMSLEASVSVSGEAATAPAPASNSTPIEAPQSYPAYDGAATDFRSLVLANFADNALASAAPVESLSHAQQIRQNPDHRIPKALISAQNPPTGMAQPQLPHTVASRTITTAVTSSAPEQDLSIDTTTTTSHTSSPLAESPPLRTGSVLPDTRIAHPKPIAVPVSASNSFSTKTQIPDHSLRSGGPVGNVAQLEATAERLSTGTSSIGDAIRDLHVELKRSDSRRSHKLATTVSTSTDEPPNLPAVGQLKRHLSNSSSIVSTNIAARHGGYSPAGFIMSPTHSLTGRLRSGSNRSAGRPDIDTDAILSRHGPGKTSVRSVRSAKMSLAEISESEPISLDKAALDAADVAPPIDNDSDHDLTMRPTDLDAAGGLPNTDAFHNMLDSSFAGPILSDFSYQTAGQAELLPGTDDSKQVETAVADNTRAERPSSSHSNNTFQQAEDAFVDFDGVHWEPEAEWDLPSPPSPPSPPKEENTPVARHRQSGMGRPKSYMDPETGQQMLFYPARVPAMLNLPPKLSSKPKAVLRNQRQSQVLSAMVQAEHHPEGVEPKRRSEIPNLSRDSWLPDPLAGHRDSFMVLTPDEPDVPEVHRTAQPETQAELDSSALRRPQRLSRNDPDVRKSRMDTLPPQLRASAFFDLPSTTPKVESKDGSAMATLDNMLDASMNAPVSAFTDHTFAGKLGPEIYGKEKKRKSKLSMSLQSPPSLGGPIETPKEPKKRASLFWFKRSTSYNSQKSDPKGAPNPVAPVGEAKSEVDAPTARPRTSSGSDDGSVRRHEEGSVSDDDEDKEMSDDDDDEAYAGPPTTLLAELQLRKQQQKQRTQPPSRQFPNGMHATLLEMDAVAEVERKNRQNKRVNLAWEEPNAHLDQNGSDDEDVPLAIIAAKHHGAKNLADLERPIGLMEKREMEDNEPLSRRRARLQGQDPMSAVLPKRQSLAALSAHIQSHIRSPSAQPPRSPAITPEPVEEEIEEETLGERKRRLDAKELPKARPVSSAFSAELLSQFGDLDEAKNSPGEGKNKENQAPTSGVEEETLGQRRQRLQAEREAREREMSYGNLVGQPMPQATRRLSMADMLAAHPKKGSDSRTLQERHRMEQEALASRDRDAKMAAMRMQMPTVLTGPTINRSGGFQGGAYNNGRGGVNNIPATQSTPALASQSFHGRNQSNATLSAFGMPMQQNIYSPGAPYGHHLSHMGGYNAGNMNPYNRNNMQPAMQMPVAPPSMDRIEQWRHGVVP